MGRLSEWMSAPMIGKNYPLSAPLDDKWTETVRDLIEENKWATIEINLFVMGSGCGGERAHTRLWWLLSSLQFAVSCQSTSALHISFHLDFNKQSLFFFILQTQTWYLLSLLKCCSSAVEMGGSTPRKICVSKVDMWNFSSRHVRSTRFL